ncbi:N-acetyltransferase [Polaribacter pacificus]|uniref:N-acetyltransferase n=1 Tax=Polaribacter pacificus TaxID=1775173 RepID=A0A917I2A6_9FLAO|nr:GNAT family N-acetyltransferase [Polaribacter pacificus]GGH02869.1 N-acetyltransferase [Polaribacter pacificus]
MIQIKKITAAQTHPIRLKVLRNGLDLPVVLDGDTHSDSFHLGAFEEKTLIAVSSYIKTNNALFNQPQYQLRGMATSNEHTRKGCGKAMLQFAEDILIEKGCKSLWFNAREGALLFYKKMGYQIVGEPFEILEIGIHYQMYKEL